MTLKQAFPEFEYLHLFQPRLDKAGQTVEDFISRLGETSHGAIPPEITIRGNAATLRFLEAFGWVYISKLIVELYPQ